jgi:hypothetical protein
MSTITTVSGKIIDRAVKKGKSKEDKTANYLEIALKIADNPDCHFISDIVAQMPCSTSTFYDHKLEQSEKLKEKLNKNRIEIKQLLRKKWLDNPNATLQIALYKLLADEHEREALRDKANNEQLQPNEGIKIFFE